MTEPIDIHRLTGADPDDESDATVSVGGGSIGLSGGEPTAAVASPDIVSADAGKGATSGNGGCPNITIETIEGKQYTVVWRDAFEWNDRNARYRDMSKQIWFRGAGGYLMNATATALPALPRYPKPEHAGLLHLYAANGFVIHFTDDIFCAQWSNPSILNNNVDFEITHATTETGERADVAIEGDV